MRAKCKPAFLREGETLPNQTEATYHAVSVVLICFAVLAAAVGALVKRALKLSPRLTSGHLAREAHDTNFPKPKLFPKAAGRTGC